MTGGAVTNKLIIGRTTQRQIVEAARRDAIGPIEGAHVRPAQRCVVGDGGLHLVTAQNEVATNAIRLFAAGQVFFATQRGFKDFGTPGGGAGQEENREQ